jgi:hypothetical protein
MTTALVALIDQIMLCLAGEAMQARRATWPGEWSPGLKNHHDLKQTKTRENSDGTTP